MGARLLWSLGSMLVVLGLAARFLGWDTLLEWPRAALQAAVEEPATTGLIALGAALMVLAGVIRRWRG